MPDRSCGNCAYQPVPGELPSVCTFCAPGTFYMNFKPKDAPETRERRITVYPKPKAADSMQIGGSHYKDMAVQPWAVMETLLTREEFIGFLKGNYLKYSMRAGKKEGSDDLGKAEHYSKKLKEVLAKA